MAGNALIIMWLSTLLKCGFTKGKRLKYLLPTAYKSRKYFLPACGGTPGHRCGLRSTAVRDRLTIEGLNDIFSIKCHRNPLYAGHSRQFGKRMSSIPRHLNASPSPGALQGTSRGEALSGSPRAKVSSRGRARSLPSNKQFKTASKCLEGTFQ